MLFVEIKNGRAVLHTKMTPQMSTIAPLLEGRRKWLVGGGFSFEPTVHNLSIVRKYIPGLHVNASINPEYIGLEGYFDGERTTSTYSPKTALYDHQKEALKRCLEKRNFALFMEQGTGKTKVAIDVAGTRFCSGEITGLLIVAPKGVHRQWIESQIPQHCGILTSCEYWPFSVKNCSIPNGLMPSDKMAVFSINIDGIKTPSGQKACFEFFAAHKNRVMMVMDESHLIKNSLSRRWRAANDIGSKAAFRLALTGTPVAKNLSDEWAQLKWLDEGIIGIRYLRSFINEYCIMGGFDNREILAHKNVESFRAKVDPFTFRATKEQIGILPKSYDRWTFDLSAEQKRLVKQIKKDLQAEISSGAITTAANAALKIMRIQQICNGFIADENGGTHRIFHPVGDNPRIAALKNFLENREGKVAIWCRFVEDIRMVMEALGSDAVAYYGAIDDSGRAKAVKGFLDPNGPRFFVSNPSTGGTGLNLQGICQSVLYYSNSENSIDRWQSEDRTHRIGTVGSVVYTDLIAKGSTDSRILQNLSKKKQISDMAIGDIESWLKKDWDQEEQPVFLDDSWMKEGVF